jgi:hypothetical protein
MGQSAHPGRPAGGHRAPVAALAVGAAVLSGGVLLTGCSTSAASAETVLRGTAGVTVVHTDGSTLAGRDDLRLRPGDVVRTGDGGRAELVTRERTVYLGSAAALQVLDGERQSLRHGAAVVDAQDGPALSLQVAGLTVSAPEGSALRAERSVTVRIGALAGDVDIESGTGRQLRVAALHQTIVGGDALPDDTTPLQLTDDDGEARTVPDLVRDDQTLLGLARGIDSTGGSTFRVVNAQWHAPLAPTPRGAARSERLLPAVIAAAGPAAGAVQRYDAAVELRRAGGSWGVVARLIGVRAAGVVDALASFDRGAGPGDGNPPSVREILAGARGEGPLAPGGGGGGRDGNRDGSGGGGGDGGGGGQPEPSASPTPTPTDGGGLIGTVTRTVEDTLSLVPTPTPSATTTSPAPLISLPGLSILP